ncbi:MAG: protein tyrosine kinase modulator [Clostridiales bacterium]|nr:protein tyrosine kinase modulator [Clostridiales bacterium]
MEQEYEIIDLREIFSLVKKNLAVIFMSVAVFALAGLLVTTLLIRPQYEATATMIVNSREDQQVQTAVTNDQINSARQLVNTYAVILKSDTVLGKTITDLKLDMDYEQLVKKVSIEAVDSTQVMKISVQDRDPETAKKIVSSIVKQAPEIIIKTVKAGSVEIISQPKAGARPVSPKKSMNTLLAGLVGGVISVGIIFLRSAMNNKFMNDKDITKHLGLTVLGVIPEIAIKE